MIPQRAMFAGICVLTAAMGSRAAAQLPGFEIVQITDDSFYDVGPSMNNCGEIVFIKRMGIPVTASEIFHYDNGETTQITDDEIQDSFPDINNSGTIVWPRVDEVSGISQILRHTNGNTTVLAEDLVWILGIPAINNLGHVVWYRSNDDNCGQGYDLFFFDGETIQQVTDNGFSNQVVELNDHDDIAWTRFDFCPGMTDWTSDIMLRPSGGRTILLPSIIGTQHQFTALNNLGQVAWRSGIPDSGGDKMIHFWENGVTTILTDWGTGPKLNNLGEIAFNRIHEDGLAQAWLYKNGEFIQATDNPFSTGVHAFNDWGEMVLNKGSFPLADKLIMRRIRTGEADFDGHIDLKDAAAFQNCYTGPGDFDGTTGGFDRLCDCRFLDIDHDRDVDRDDYALFAIAMTGPQ